MWVLLGDTKGWSASMSSHSLTSWMPIFRMYWRCPSTSLLWTATCSLSVRSSSSSVERKKGRSSHKQSIHVYWYWSLFNSNLRTLGAKARFVYIHSFNDSHWTIMSSHQVKHAKNKTCIPYLGMGGPLGRTSSVTSFGIPVQCKTNNIIKLDSDVKTTLNQHAGHCPY